MSRMRIGWSGKAAHSTALQFGAIRHAHYRVFCGVVAALSVWLRTAFPVHAIPAAAADDALFVGLARSLVAGHWLGAFNNVTLVKGMFYPLFIAGAFVAGVPLKIAEQCAYLAAAALIAGLVRRLLPGRDWFACLVFCALALNPVMWIDPLARVIREGLYGGLSLAVIGCSILTGFGFESSVLPDGRSLRRRVLFGSLAGLVGGCFWLTREEGLWLVPAVGCVVCLAIAEAVIAWHAAGRPGSRQALAWRLARPWLAALVAMQLVIGTVGAINAWHYGVFETTEVQSPAFRRGYGALARIEQDHWQRYSVFSRDARIAAYRVSPAARELEPSLDGPVGNAWRLAGCTQTGQKACPEILGGWFQWALRDAVAAAGHYRTAATAAAFYTRLADEIDAACLQGTLHCLPPRATLAPPFRIQYVGDALRTAPRLMRIMLHPGADGIGVSPSVGQDSMIRDFADFVGPVMPPADGARRISGWVSAAGGFPALGERSATGAAMPSSLAVSAAPDVIAAFPGRRAVRFDLDSTCADCALAVSLDGNHDTLFPIREMAAGQGMTQAGVTVFVDHSETADGRASAARRRILLRIAGVIATVYGHLLAPACLLGAIGLAASLVRRPRAPVALIALALSCLVAVMTRVALLSYLEVTSIPSVNSLYASPAEPLLVVFALVGCCVGLGSRTRDPSALSGPLVGPPPAKATHGVT